MHQFEGRPASGGTAGLEFGVPRRSRRPSLTPMVDVVFLLLVFFMLAARFTADRTVPLMPPGESDGAYSGAPRIVTVTVEGLKLNGAPVALADLGPELRRLMPSPDAAVVLQSGPEARLQELVLVLDHLGAAGFSNLVIAE